MSRNALAALGGALALLALGPEAQGAPPATFPAAGEIIWSAVAVRSQPDPSVPRITVMRRFRSDFRLNVVHAIGARNGSNGRLWYRIRLAHRPNGMTGWIPARSVSVEPMTEQIVIRRGARLLELFRGEHLLLRTRVAVGAPGMETPLGRFYITAKFRPSLAILGAYAIETSAYSRLSEWPGGGVVGVHGTPMPWLLGQAVSHGCVRVANRAILRIRQLAPLGTPIWIVR